jgi:hypothetical protein
MTNHPLRKLISSVLSIALAALVSIFAAFLTFSILARQGAPFRTPGQIVAHLLNSGERQYKMGEIFLVIVGVDALTLFVVFCVVAFLLKRAFRKER